MEKKNHSLPTLAIDSWVQKAGVERIINHLLMDLVAARPNNIREFIHHWSSPSSSSSISLISQKQEKQKENEEEINVISTRAPSYEENSDMFEWPPKIKRYEEENLENDRHRNSEENNNNNNNNNNNRVRVEGPTVEDLKSQFPNAKNSPFIFLMKEEECAARFRRASSISLSTSGFGVCLGRGNYGFVVPAILKSDLLINNNNNNNNNTNNNNINRGYCSSENIIYDSHREESIRRAIEQKRIIALKISRIQALWSLDEVNSLRRITSNRNYLEKEVQTLQERIKALRKSNESGANPISINNNNNNSDFYHQQQAASSNNENEIQRLEECLHMHQIYLTGARLVTSLVGEIMYDAEKDVLLIPLEYYPSTLGECIRARRRRCSHLFSTSSTLSFPDISVNDRGETIKVFLFSLQEIQHVAWSLCCALTFLHNSCDLVHLDVKVDNILLSHPWVGGELPFTVDFHNNSSSNNNNNNNNSNNNMPNIILGDFGLAQPIGDPILQLGDFATMSPEVYWAINSENYNSNNYEYNPNKFSNFTGANDMWSVGCVILQMMNGLEYASWEANDIFTSFKENYISPAPKHPQWWPMILNDFILKCFERDPQHRMSAMEALQHPLFTCRQ